MTVSDRRESKSVGLPARVQMRDRAYRRQIVLKIAHQHTGNHDEVAFDHDPGSRLVQLEGQDRRGGLDRNGRID